MPRRLGTHPSAWIAQEPGFIAPIYATAKLVSSLRQGVGGLSEVSTANQGVGDSLNMWLTMLTRPSTYHLPPIWRAPRPSPESTPPPSYGSSLRQGVGGLSEVGTAGQGAGGSLDMW